MFDYSFAVARVSAAESSILNKDALQRITSDKNAVSSLMQTGYGKGEKTVSDMTDRELSEARAFVKKYLPDTLYPLLLLPYDCHNLKVLLKSQVKRTDPKPYLYDNTVYDTEIAAACCRGGEFSLLSENMANILNAAYDNGELSFPFDISVTCDRAFYREISDISKNAPDPVKDYIKSAVDFKNYVSYLRCKNTSLDMKMMKMTMLDGGYIDISIFEKAYSDKAESLADVTFGYPTHDAILNVESLSLPSISAVSAAFDEELMKRLEKYKYETDSPVPLFLYFAKKVNEAYLVREAFSKIRSI